MVTKDQNDWTAIVTCNDAIKFRTCMQLLYMYVFLTIYNALKIAVVRNNETLFNNIIIYAYPQCELHKSNPYCTNELYSILET